MAKYEEIYYNFFNSNFLFFIEFNEVFAYTCVETSSYIMHLWDGELDVSIALRFILLQAQ